MSESVFSESDDAPSTICKVRGAQLAAAAQPGEAMDESSSKLLDQELKTLKCRRMAKAIDLEAPRIERDPRGRVLRTDLTGIALSGGGIRSATFCLGVLQALAKAGLLKRFDYLSTVSGGGYIGSSLTWWLSGLWQARMPEPDRLQESSSPAHGPGLHDAPAGNPLIPKAEADLLEFGLEADNFPYGVDGASNVDLSAVPKTAKQAGPRLLDYLRKHGNYLTPGAGIGFWSGVAVAIRAMFVNLFVWIPIITAGFLFIYWLPRSLFPYSNYVFTLYTLNFGTFIEHSEQMCADTASWASCVSLILNHDLRIVSAPLFAESYELGTAALAVVFKDALLIAGVFIVFAVVYYNWIIRGQGRTSRQADAASWPWLAAIGVISAGILLYAPPDLPHDFQRVWLLILAAIMAGTFGILCLAYSFLGYVLSKCSVWFEKSRNGDRPHPERLTGRCARAGRDFGYVMRRLFETWAGVYLFVFAGLLVIGSVPILADWLAAPAEGDGQPSPTAPGPGVGSGFAALLAGLAATIAAFLRSGATVGDRLRALGFQVPGGFTASLAAGLLLFGVLVISYQASFAILSGEISPMAAFWVLAAAVFFGCLVNTSYVSLGRFYRDRLLEAFMPAYDAAISGQTEAAPPAADRMRLYQASCVAPYHIINANTVLVRAKDRRRKLRGGDSFILTRDYCGSNATGWRRTKEFMAGRMTVPTAMAVSGAAANPNTGVGGVGLTRSKVVSALMALVNLRLGLWVPHPLKGKQHAIPNHFRPGFTSFFVGSTEDYRFQELTDGGHFDNLGIYELIRRRPRLILVCDGAADPGFQFGDLQTALHRIKEDFGASIEFCESYQIEHLIPEKVAGATYPKDLEQAKRGFAVARIYYASDLDPHGQARPDAPPAWLVYLKSTTVPGLPLELRGYKGHEMAFPNQSTGDQFFDEDQFEAYRQLGQQLTDAMINELHLDQGLPKDRLAHDQHISNAVTGRVAEIAEQMREAVRESAD